jgi:uncharacterized protein YkwD
MSSGHDCSLEDAMVWQRWFEIKPVPTLVMAIVFTVALPGVGTRRAEAGPHATEKQQLVDRINQERVSHKLKELADHRALDAAAQSYAQLMAAQNQFGHELEHTNPVDRAVAQGYPTRIIGETLSWQSELDPSAVVTQWLASEIHRGILLGEYDHIGVGLAHRPDGAYFWAVVVGRAHVPSPALPPQP